MNELNLIELLAQTGPVNKFVLLILILFSIGSWSVILAKAALLRRIRRESEVFWKIFRKGQSLSEIATACETLRFTPLVPVFNAGAALLHPHRSQPQGSSGISVAVRMAAVSPAVLQRALQRASAAQLSLLEQRMTFLATTASATPFIGLFGTVWGVMRSFTGLANTNVASLRAVAPGIAEALIATAAGLFAAIPAVIAYNHFLHQIRNIGGQLDDLQVELLAIAERNDV